MKDMETLCRLYLELAHVVPEGTKTFKEIALENEIKKLRGFVAKVAQGNTKLAGEAETLLSPNEI